MSTISLPPEAVAATIRKPLPEGRFVHHDTNAEMRWESVTPDQHRVPVALRDPYHQPHLQNFFDAIRGTATLHCPAEVGYETAVTVLKVNEAIEAKKQLSFRPEEFRI